MQPAMSWLAIDYFQFDIDFQVARTLYLLLFLLKEKLSDTSPFKDYKIDMYVDCKLV